MNEVFDVVGIGLGSLLLVVMLQLMVLMKRLFYKPGNGDRRPLGAVKRA